MTLTTVVFKAGPALTLTFVTVFDWELLIFKHISDDVDDFFFVDHASFRVPEPLLVHLVDLFPSERCSTFLAVFEVHLLNVRFDRFRPEKLLGLGLY